VCLAAVALGAHPRYALVIAANRDEFHDRAARAAHWWDEGWFGGRDLAAGGTWLGVRRDGRWAFVTNVREGGRRDAAARSRGELVVRALRAPSVDAEVDALRREGNLYNGYNLLAGDVDEALWSSNRSGPARRLPRGVSALSNAALGTPWPKVERLRAATTAWASSGRDDLDPLFDALADRALAPDDALPATGVPLDRERRLSAAFIAGDRYGTRCSTVLALERGGTAHFVERSFGPAGAPAGVVDERFVLG
jgi:uncharacterized protein with NRDE domain